ncbi:ArsR/SmtB family transcription factor [Actinomycetospora sp. NBC_00405]|uniref:ArsR/SmtB family transcription factor n=1 Tax=Actinomycetospora sp. NBC_00405 TaxID=2975952 RepID=UPI002E24DE21
MSRPSVAEHLAVLRQASLVTDEPRGRQRFYSLNPDPLEQVGAWLHPFERCRASAPCRAGSSRPSPTSASSIDDHRQRDACERMGPGWRDTVLPRLAELVEDLAAYGRV